MSRRAVFLDFQGTLGGEGLDDIRALVFYPFTIEALKILNSIGILVIGITNQSHISKGVFTWGEYEAALRLLEKELSENNAHFDAVYCCPHEDKDNCGCKKPKKGMIESAMDDFDIDIEHSFVVGDMGMTDMVLARNVGAKAILVLTGVGKGSLNEYRHTWQNIDPDYIANNVLDAAHYIASIITEPERLQV